MKGHIRHQYELTKVISLLDSIEFRLGRNEPKLDLADSFSEVRLVLTTAIDDGVLSQISHFLKMEDTLRGLITDISYAEEHLENDKNESAISTIRLIKIALKGQIKSLKGDR